MIIICAACLGLSQRASARSWNLDSIREWGRFPRFVVDTYRWGDQFFNGYDTLYVKGTGYKFNVKARTDSWVDYYNFDLPDNMRMRMLSDASTSVGAYVQYLAVSLGYDINVSKLFGSEPLGRTRFNFGFNCSLFAVEGYTMSNTGGTRISKFGHRGNTYNPNIDFHGMKVTSTGIDVYYFFNHKRYSQAAAFSFGRVQQRSQGSFYAGFSYLYQNYDFDFSTLPESIKEYFPTSWKGYRYLANSRNYLLKGGYAYNWVPRQQWTIGASVSPSVGIKYGYLNNEHERRTTFGMNADGRVSVVWNHGRWFIGAVGQCTLWLIYDRDSTFSNALITGNVCAGYRFNLW